jgi:hypothetical protein
LDLDKTLKMLAANVGPKIPVEPNTFDPFLQKTKPSGDVPLPVITEPVKPVKIKPKKSWMPAQSSHHFIAGG